MRDNAISLGVQLLRAKGLLPSGEDSDDDYVPQCEGVEW